MTDRIRGSILFGLFLVLLTAWGCGGGVGGANSSDPNVATNLIVTQTLPTNGQEIHSLKAEFGGNIQIWLSELVMVASVRDDNNVFNQLSSDLNILDSGFNRVPGTLLQPQIGDQTDRVVFRPQYPVLDAGEMPNGQYTITVSRDVRNWAGGRLNLGRTDHRSSFTVGTDTYAPVIRSTFPARDQKDVPKNSQIIIIFNESLNPATVTNATVTVVDGGTNPPTTIQGTLTTARDNFEVVFTPDPANPMPPNATIVVTVTGGNSGITDVVGNPYAGDPPGSDQYQFQFETVTEPPLPVNPLTIDANNGDAGVYYATAQKFGVLQEGAFLGNTADFTLWGQGNPVPNSETIIGQPEEIIVDPRFGSLDGHSWIYVIDRASRSVTIVGSRDSRIVHRWRDFPDPRGLGVATSGLTLYVTNYANDSVSFVDVGSASVGSAAVTDPVKRLSQLRTSQNPGGRQDVQVGRGPLGAAHAPDANLLFVANNIDNTCSLIATSTATVNTTFSIGTAPQDVAATWFYIGIGRFAFISCLGGGGDDNGSVSLYWDRPNGLQANITGFQNPKGLIFDRGVACWVANSGGTTSSQLTLAFAGGGFAATVLPQITATANVGKNPTSVTMESFYPFFGFPTRAIITADRGSGQLSFIDNNQPSRPIFTLRIPGVHEVASYYDQ